MTRVHIVTDGNIQFVSQPDDRLDVTIIPVAIQAGDEKYEDIGGEHNEEVLRRVDSERIRPKILGPTEDDFREVYSRLSRSTDQIISIHSSAALSGIVSSALTAAADYLGRCDIVVVDSQTTSLGLALLVQEASEMARAGCNREEILRSVRGMIARIYVVMFTDTLDFLERSGRISPAQCILGTMLGIKPFLAIEGGEIIPMEKVRGRDRGLDKLVEFAAEFSRIERIAILQSTSEPTDETLVLRERLQGFFPNVSSPILVYGPLLASHVGPDGLGLVAYEGARPREPF